MIRHWSLAVEVPRFICAKEGESLERIRGVAACTKPGSLLLKKEGESLRVILERLPCVEARNGDLLTVEAGWTQSLSTEARPRGSGETMPSAP
jgi:hypothetical protein